jgi:hypothetical protein
VDDGTRDPNQIRVIRIVFMALDPFYGPVVALSSLAGEGRWGRVEREVGQARTAWGIQAGRRRPQAAHPVDGPPPREGSGMAGLGET